jgi:alpha-tubulin suppressor-like RCC1 family protein
MRRPMRWLERFGVTTVASLLIAATIGTVSAQAATPRAVAVSAGDSGACVVLSSGGVQCWGQNGSGEIGDGTAIRRNGAAVLPDLKSGVAQVSSGYHDACAVTTAGAVKCWGANGNGQLGDGLLTSSARPVDVVGLTSGVAQVAVQGNSACALLTGGEVQCWGSNVNGQLGDGTNADSATPVDVIGLTEPASQISVGFGYACAVTTRADLLCWGLNDVGQLGDGTNSDSNTPIDVAGLDGRVAQVSAGGGTTCAVTTNARLLCWGSNTDGALGIGTTDDSNTPIDVRSLDGRVAGVSVGTADACALLRGTGGVRCWGSNAWGQLGIGTDGPGTDSYTPVPVSGLVPGIAQVSVGSMYACALTTAGLVMCWGIGGSGQLGEGTYHNSGFRDPSPSHVDSPVKTIGFIETTTTVKLGHTKLKPGVTQTITVRVESAKGTPKGVVEIFLNGQVEFSEGAFGWASLTNGTATLSLNVELDPGTFTMGAVFDGLGGFSSSVSAGKRFLVK